MNWKIALFFLAFSVFAAGAGAAEMTINSPTADQVFTVGDPIMLDYNADVNIYITGANGFVEGRYLGSLYTVSAGNETLRHYQTTINTVGFPAGVFIITIYISYRNSPQEAFQFVNGTVAVRLIPPIVEDSNAPVTVVRILPETMYAGGFAFVSLAVLPKTSFPGIILRETAPSGIRIQNFLKDAGIESDSIIQGNFIKIVLRKSDGIPNRTARYNIEVGDLPPETILRFDGNWSIEGINGVTVGAREVRIGGFRIPECPLSDQQLLQFITKWSRSEVNNAQILQVIERWIRC